jgi:hypothetical protein
MRDQATLSRRSVGIVLRRFDTENMTPERFLKLSASERRDMASCEVVAPTLDGRGFGGFRVRWKTPRFHA